MTAGRAQVAAHDFLFIWLEGVPTSVTRECRGDPLGHGTLGCARWVPDDHIESVSSPQPLWYFDSSKPHMLAPCVLFPAVAQEVVVCRENLQIESVTHAATQLMVFRVMACFFRRPCCLSRVVSGSAHRRKRESLTSGLKLLAFVGRYVLVYAGCVFLLSRAEGGIEVRRRFSPSLPTPPGHARYRPFVDSPGGLGFVSRGSRQFGAPDWLDHLLLIAS